MLSSFSRGGKGRKKVKVNKRKCADESKQVACRAASQALLAGVSLHRLRYQFPLSGSSKLTQLRQSLGFRRLMPAEAPEMTCDPAPVAVLCSVAITGVTSAFSVLVSRATERSPVLLPFPCFGGKDI